jgi:hypothetical protein
VAGMFKNFCTKRSLSHTNISQTLQVDVNVKCSLCWPTLTKSEVYRQNIVKLSNANKFKKYIILVALHFLYADRTDRKTGFIQRHALFRLRTGNKGLKEARTIVHLHHLPPNRSHMLC